MLICSSIKLFVLVFLFIFIYFFIKLLICSQFCPPYRPWGSFGSLCVLLHISAAFFLLLEILPEYKHFWFHTFIYFFFPWFLNVFFSFASFKKCMYFRPSVICLLLLLLETLKKFISFTFFSFLYEAWWDLLDPEVKQLVTYAQLDSYQEFDSLQAVLASLALSQSHKETYYGWKKYRCIGVPMHTV